MKLSEVRNFLDGLSQRGLFKPDMEWRDALALHAENYDPENPDQLPTRSLDSEES